VAKHHLAQRNDGPSRPTAHLDILNDYAQHFSELHLLDLGGVCRDDAQHCAMETLVHR
jgi:hypothetical protein